VAHSASNVVDHLVSQSMIQSDVAHLASNVVNHPVGQSMMPSDVVHSIPTDTLAPRLNESLFQRSLDVIIGCFEI